MAKDHATCGSKRRYWNKTDALIHAGIVEDKYGDPMRVYPCPTCRGWHLSKKRPLSTEERGRT